MGTVSSGQWCKEQIFSAGRSLVATASFQVPLGNERKRGAGLWSASSDWTIKRWDIAGEKCLGTLTEHTDKVESLAVSADGTIVASAGGDKSIRLWNAETGAALFTLNGHTKAVRAVAFSPDGQTLATGSYDKTVKLWHAESGQFLTTLEGHPDTVRTVAFSPNGKTLAVGGAGIKLWDLAKGQAVTFPAGHK